MTLRARIKLGGVVHGSMFAYKRHVTKSRPKVKREQVRSNLWQDIGTRPIGGVFLVAGWPTKACYAKSPTGQTQQVRNKARQDYEHHLYRNMTLKA